MDAPRPEASVAPAAEATTRPLVAVAGLAITHEGADAATPAGVSFEVRAGEVVLVLGPSGSGKSTLALALNGLIPHAVPADVTGSVVVDGIDAASASVAVLSTRVGMVFQDPDAQLVTGTVLDEVAFGPENLRMPVADVLARAEAALRRVGLWERRRDNPDRLSGGGRQRLAIACALAMGSPLLVLDEPTANLDPQGIDEVYAALADLVRDGDRAIVLVEHNLDAAVGFVDRVIVLDHDGLLVADGPTDAVLRGRAEELHDLGVWLPTSTLAALRLRGAGFALEPLPLTPDELHAALEAEDPPGTRTDTPTPVAGTPGTFAGGPGTVAGSPNPVAEPVEASRHDPSTSSGTVGGGSGTVGGGSGTVRSSSRSAGGAHRDDPLITVRDLTLDRGRTRVLDGISLDIRAGEFVAIVGANGAGKTRLIQAIAGVVPPPRGAVTIGDPSARPGRPLDVGRSDARTLSSRIGFVFQNPEHQFIAHTVYDELAHGLRRQHLDEAEIRERTEHVLERFGLRGRANAHPFLLSGGQKRRLSVGTALVGGAPVLALDEPTFGQDRARADELLGLLEELNREGTTIIVVTHDMQLVTEHADRTIVLENGRVLANGETAEVFADAALIERAGLRLPPLRRALQGLTRHPSLSRIVRLADLPGAEAGAA